MATSRCGSSNSAGGRSPQAAAIDSKESGEPGRWTRTMGTPRTVCSVTLCTLLIIGSIASAQNAPAQNQSSTQTLTSNQTQITVPFSDPSRPGTVKVSLVSGSISVRVGTGREVIVTSLQGDRDKDQRD